MKKIYVFILVATAAFCSPVQTNAQCATTATLGTATNMFTLIRNGNHPIVVDKTMNMVAFIHRTDAALLGGNSGELRYDISTNAGSTWTLNQGVLNPLNSNYARYPNLAIYNPSNNITPGNAYLNYLAPTITSATSVWNGIVGGVSQVGTAVTTESYNPNGIGTNQIPHSLVKGASGVFWAIDPINTIATGFNIYRGDWNSSTNDINWTLNFTTNPPFATSWTSAPQVVDYNIAFDPSGQIGYFSFLGQVTGSPTTTAVYPILYKTVNGGASWTGPITVDISGMSCITGNVITGSAASCNVEHDLIVDVNGNPHIISTVGSAANNIFNYSAWHHMFDFTISNGVWVAHDLGNVNGGAFTFGISPNFATMWQAPQAARSADGTKLFFTWTDNASYSLGTGNSMPDIFGKAYNVTTGQWTPTKNFSACNTAINGRILFPHIAAEVLEPSASSWKLAGVFGVPSVTNDLGAVANFYFLDNMSFSVSEFSISVPPATVTIAQAPSVLFCPNTTVNISVSGAGQVIWSNGATTNPLPITSSSISTYSVIAQVGCLSGTASIGVSSVNVVAGALSTSVCPGGAASFTASGNALTYSWMPGNATGTNVTINTSVSTVTLIATGSSSCQVINTVAINVLPTPTVTISGALTTCSNYVASYTASGAQSYNWTNGGSSSTTTFIASTNTILSVVGTAANSCTNLATASVVVNPSPLVNATQNATAICNGESAVFIGTGSAASYSWNGSGTGPNLIATPSISTVYTLSGSNSFNCISSKTVGIIVHPLPTLSVSATRTAICKSEKQILTASGASTYTWLPLGIISPTMIYNGSQAGTFTLQVQMLSAEGCSNTGVFAMLVSNCTGIEDSQLNATTRVWPNPSNGLVNFLTDESGSYIIVNQLGQVVERFELQSNQIKQLDLIVPGVYFIRSEQGLKPTIRLIIND